MDLDIGSNGWILHIRMGRNVLELHDNIPFIYKNSVETKSCIEERRLISIANQFNK